MGHIQMYDEALESLKKDRAEYLAICDENNREYVQDMLDDSGSNAKIESADDFENYIDDFGIETNDDDIIYTAGVLAGIDSAMRIIQKQYDEADADLVSTFGE
jgi:Mn-containing catalase